MVKNKKHIGHWFFPFMLLLCVPISHKDMRPELHRAERQLGPWPWPAMAAFRAERENPVSHVAEEVTPQRTGQVPAGFSGGESLQPHGYTLSTGPPGDSCWAGWPGPRVGAARTGEGRGGGTHEQGGLSSCD